MTTYSTKPMALSSQHIDTVNRKRRIIVNHQADGLLNTVNAGLSIDQIMEYEFAFNDEPDSHIDAQWWSLDNLFPCKARPLIDKPIPGYIDARGIERFQRWADQGINLAKVYHEQTKKRGIESFYSYRLNEGLAQENPNVETKPTFLDHPNWLVKDEWGNPHLDFAVAQVRQYKADLLRELIEDFDFDGLEIDFSRGTTLTQAGRQWINRGHVTDFVRNVRRASLEVEKVRNRPVLIAVRVPDNLVGCHFDGLDIETWIGENLVDMIVLGVRSYDLDIPEFRGLVTGKPIKIIATLDDHHCSDGYSWPAIEVWRGAAANWWHQGADAIQTFNWGVAGPQFAQRYKFSFGGAYVEGGPRIQLYQQAYHELGDPHTLKYMDKHFIVQRRGGGGSGGASVNDWSTPRFNYQNTNMLGPLPAPLDQAGKTDTQVRLYVADNLIAESKRIESLTLRLLLSDPAANDLPTDNKMDPVSINPFWDRDKIFNFPPAKALGEQLQVRVNNIPLTGCIADNGWFIFHADPACFAVGENLVGVLAEARNRQAMPCSLEKLELHVSYREP